MPEMIASDAELPGLRWKNGYGITTSAFSPSSIGVIGSTRAQGDLDVYSADASFQLSRVKTNHWAPKIPHLQVNYPHTCSRLDKEGKLCRRKTPEALKRFPPESQEPLPASGASNVEGESGAAGGSPSPWAKEAGFNRGKMAYNRDKGRRAEVESIITGGNSGCPSSSSRSSSGGSSRGKTPDTRKVKGGPLFPQNATHTQLLHIMQGHMDRPQQAGEPAPAVPRERKWLGGELGWEGNRGLCTPEGGQQAKDGAARPWPSTDFGHFIQYKQKPLYS